MKKFYFVLALIFILLSSIIYLTGGLQLPNETSGNSSNLDQKISVHFIDVGQADCILLEMQNEFMLIDGGNYADSDFVIDYLRKQGVLKLDYVVGTHPHEDHIGGLVGVITNFSVGKIYMPKLKSNSKVFENLLNAIRDKGLKINTAKSGVFIETSSGALLNFLGPVLDNYEDLNNFSAVIKLSFGKTKFLFMGDAEFVAENDLLDSNADLNADVIKVGHHGSNTSTSARFLEAVSPDIAVISVGSGNSYSHPGNELLDRLDKTRIFRTDLDGTIVLETDGVNVSVYGGN